MKFHQKIKSITTVQYSKIPFLGIYLEKTKTLVQKDICNPIFSTAL